MANKISNFFKTYGKVGVATFLTCSAINYGMVYFAIREGVDFKALGNKVGYTGDEKKWEYIESLGPYAAAYLIYKTMAPLRWPIVIGTTSFLVRKGKFVK